MSPDLLPLDPRWIAWLAGMLVHAGWIGTVVGLVAWAVLVRVRDPRHRHGLGLAALGMIAGGLVIAAVAAWPEAPSAPAPPTATTIVAAPPAPAPATIAAPAPARSVDAPVDWQAWAVLVWAFGVALLLIRHGIGHGRVLLLRRSAHPAGADLRARVAAQCRRLRLPVPMILLSHRIQVPAATGWLRPALLLPISLATALPPAQVEALILHELAHLRRRDALIEAGMGALECLLFFHPAVWWLGRQVREAREQCCDQDALGAGAAPDSLARALLAVAEGVVAPPPAMAATGGPLTARVRRILGLPERRRPLRGLLAVLLLPALAVAVAACAGRVDATMESSEPSAPTTIAADAPRRFALERRIRALADPRTLRSTAMVVTGDGDFWARAGVDPERQRVLPPDVADRLAAAFAGDGAESLAMALVTHPLQQGSMQVLQQTAFLSDYRFVDGTPDPLITNLAHGHATDLTVDIVAGDGAVVTDLRFHQTLLIGTRTAHLRFPGDEGTDRTWPVEEPVQAIGEGTLVGTDIRLPAGHALVVPVRTRIVHHRASIRAEATEIREGRPEAMPTGNDRWRTMVLVRTTIDAQPAVTRDRLTQAPDAAWFAATTVSVTAHDEPLPAVLARLAAQLPVPTRLQRDPDTAATRVTIAATDEPLATVLGRLLPQTLLSARVGATGMDLTTPAGPLPDHPAVGDPTGTAPADPEPVPPVLDMLPWPRGAEPAIQRLYDVSDLVIPAQGPRADVPGWTIAVESPVDADGSRNRDALLYRLTGLVPTDAWQGDRGIEIAAGSGLLIHASPAVHEVIATALAGLRRAMIATVSVRLDLMRLDGIGPGPADDEELVAMKPLTMPAEPVAAADILPGGVMAIAAGQRATAITTGTGWMAGMRLEARAFPSQDRRYLSVALDMQATEPGGGIPRRQNLTATVPDGGTLLLRTPRRDVALRLTAALP